MELKNRYDFLMIFDVENGNPNGDPDAGNMPRVDAETSIGIVTDVCLKRKIRNYVELSQNGKAGYSILIKSDKSLNSKFTDAYKNCSIKEKSKELADIMKAQKYICDNYFDVRTFGAVMTTGDNSCGIVRGPVQINFARSIDPILPQEITITRQALTKDSDFSDGKVNTMGKKTFVPYGLYVAEGYVSAALAEKTGFSTDDLDILWDSIIKMFDVDHSSLRGKMCMRKLIVFEHDSYLGNCPSHVLFDKVNISKKVGIECPRHFSDYDIVIDEVMPEGVTLNEKI